MRENCGSFGLRTFGVRNLRCEARGGGETGLAERRKRETIEQEFRRVYISCWGGAAQRKGRVASAAVTVSVFLQPAGHYRRRPPSSSSLVRPPPRHLFDEGRLNASYLGQPFEPPNAGVAGI